MARRRPLTGHSELVPEIIVPTKLFEEDEHIDLQPFIAYNQGNDVNRVDIQLKFPAQVTRIGLVSGEQYVWDGAGSVVSVLHDDVEQLLQLKIGDGACCGGSPNFLFERI